MTGVVEPLPSKAKTLYGCTGRGLSKNVIEPLPSKAKTFAFDLPMTGMEHTKAFQKTRNFVLRLL